MKRFIELKGHPEVGFFLEDLGVQVDNARDRVLNEVRNGDHDTAMMAVGRHDALKELLSTLIGKG